MIEKRRDSCNISIQLDNRIGFAKIPAYVSVSPLLVLSAQCSLCLLPRIDAPLSSLYTANSSRAPIMSANSSAAAKRKLRPARKQVKPGEIDKSEGPQPGKEYSGSRLQLQLHH
jgi:hypothetical protein